MPIGFTDWWIYRFTGLSAPCVEGCGREKEAGGAIINFVLYDSWEIFNSILG